MRYTRDVAARCGKGLGKGTDRRLDRYRCPGEHGQKQGRITWDFADTGTATDRLIEGMYTPSMRRAEGEQLHPSTKRCRTGGGTCCPRRCSPSRGEVACRQASTSRPIPVTLHNQGTASRPGSPGRSAAPPESVNGTRMTGQGHGPSFKRLRDIPVTQEPWSSRGPCNPRNAIVAGSRFLMREVELSAALASSVTRPLSGARPASPGLLPARQNSVHPWVLARTIVEAGWRLAPSPPLGYMQMARSGCPCVASKSQVRTGGHASD